jgi:two-component system OmpR family sensor kinase
MRIRSIRARLTLWYSGLLAVTFLLLGGVGYGLLAYSLGHDVDAALNSVARALAERSYSGSTSFLPSEIDEVFRRFFDFSPWDRYFGMFDPLGRMDPRFAPPGSGKLHLSPKALKNAAQGHSTFETVEGLARYPVRILTVPVVKAGRVVNLIQVGMSLENSYWSRHRFLLAMTGVLSVALFLAGGGGWLLARRALGPVDRMAEAARRISTENLAERLADSGAGDELSRLAQTLNEMLGRLEDSFRQIRQFSADASHELQTPLTILKGEIEVALRSPRSPEEYQRILKSALEEIDRLAGLAEGLLHLARADAGVLRMDRRTVDLARLVEEVYEQGKVLAGARAITLSLGRMEPISVQGDEERLKRVLLNLLDNGVKYTPAGGHVTLSLERTGEEACLKVEDTGIGLSAEEQDRVFERFYRSAEARSSGEAGAGLGLCIARSIVEAHGGRIEVESSPGLGSTFTLVLPALP